MAMAAGTFSSRILGFLRDSIMMALFPRSVTDAYVVAFRLANMFRRVLGEGALSPSFVPLYVEARTRSEEESKKLSSAVFSITFAVSTILAMACFVLMDPIMKHWVGTGGETAADLFRHGQTVFLARIMIFYLWM